MENLTKSFPEKTEQEIRKICRAYYRYLGDLILESLKTLTISEKAMLKHCSMQPSAKLLFDQLVSEKKSGLIVLGHHGNWEWAGNTFALLCQQPLYVIYHPLSNPYFNGLMCRMRQRFGTRLITMHNAFRKIKELEIEINLTAFIADQSPHPDHAYWVRFLHQDTPVFPGTEKIAQKMNYPIIYVNLQRLKRGYYCISAEMLIEDPKEYAPGEISRIHTERLEKDIISQPETWLWSHRRWKHQRSLKV